MILTIKYIKILTNILIFSRLLAQQTAGVYGGNASRQRVERSWYRESLQPECNVGKGDLCLRETLVNGDVFDAVGKDKCSECVKRSDTIFTKRLIN